MPQPLEKTDAFLSALTLPTGAPWLDTARDAARARLRDLGLPAPRDEYWRWTRPAAFLAPDHRADARHKACVFDGVEALTVVFRDGVFDAEASDALALDGVEITRLAEVAELPWAEALYGALETRGHDPVARPFAALNTAMATDGLLIRATGRVARPIHIRHIHDDAESAAMLHHLVRVEEGADVTLIESGAPAARFNTALEVDVADKAGFHHIRSLGRDHDRQALTHLYGRLGAQSTFKSFTLAVNGQLTRNEAVVEFTGDEAVAHVAGACIGEGDFHHDDTVFVTHDAVNCESRQVFKKVLRRGAKGVFQGKILVKPDAQKTDGYQISQSLLLDDTAEFLAKPELEIYADDVACSHGSTTGAIDEDGLFYLRARGVPRDVATDLMVLAFLAEALDEIEDDALRDILLARLEEWLTARREG